MPKEENKRTVRQKDADELHATTTPSPTAPPTIVEQSDPSKLKATVTQAAKDRTVTNDVNTINLSQLVPKEYDYIGLTYADVNLTSVVYKTGGATGATVATLTLAYTDSVLNSITRT